MELFSLIHFIHNVAMRNKKHELIERIKKQEKKEKKSFLYRFFHPEEEEAIKDAKSTASESLINANSSIM